MAYLMGIDIGTSATKTVLFDLSGNTVASSSSEYEMYQPQMGWAEQDPQDWWTATCESIRNVLKQSGVRPADIKALGLSGQMHGLVMLGKNGQVLRRSIIWCDQRTGKECEQITGSVGKERLIEITANPALTGFTASKLLWVRNNQPHIYESCRKILLPKDYIRYMLTGEYATEVSDASGMQLLDIRKRDWSDEVLAKLHIDKSLLGKVYESCVVSGKINKEASESTGLLEGTPVVGGAGDQAAAAVGNGIVKTGLVSSTIGTSGVVFAHLDEVKIDPKGRVHTFCHAVPGAWHVMGVTQGAGLSLQWFRDNFCVCEKETARKMGTSAYVLMDREAQNVPVGANGVIYLPYLMGERTPHLDPYAKGVFFGLSAIHKHSDLLRAVMEGVTFSLRDCLEVIRSMDIPVAQVRASGGGGKSMLWRQLQADVFGTPVYTIDSAEGGALGVALLAGVGAGVWSSVEDACDAVIQVKDEQSPNLQNVKRYEAYYQVYRDLYISLKEQFINIAAITQ